jgi:hypothetical protein
METLKLQLDRHKINYWKEDGSYLKSVYILPQPFVVSDKYPGSLAMAIAIQEEIIKYIVTQTAWLGSIIADPNAIDSIRRLAAIVPIEGGGVGIDVDNLLNVRDYLQIGKLFISESYDSIGTMPEEWKPSAIARLNGMNFEGKRIEIAMSNLEDLRARETKRFEMMQPPEPTTDMPLVAAATGK